ncbi:MAG: metalloregulator ArsR/SmtB family transcription factor [Pseudomonadota bacterium]
MESKTLKMQDGPIGPDDAAEMFAALGAPVRLSILRALVRAGQPGMTVGALQERLAMPASTLSHHLRALVQADVITQEREGRSLICRAAFPNLEGLAAFLLTECCADQGETRKVDRDAS